MEALLVVSIGLVPFLLSVWKWPRAMFIMLPLFFTLYLVQINILGVPFTALELMVWALFLVTMVNVIWKKELRKTIRHLISPKRIELYMTLFVLVSTMTLLWTPSEIFFQTGIPGDPVETFSTLKIALGIWKGWLLPLWLYTIMGGIYAPTESEGKRSIEWYIVGAVTMVCLGVVLQYILGVHSTIDGRFGAVFVSGNYLAFYVAPAILALYVVILDHAKVSMRSVLQCIGFIGLGFALFLSRSYTALGVVAVIIAIYSVWKLSWKLWLPLACIGVLILGGLVYVERDSEKFQTLLSFDERSSVGTRGEVYEVSIDQLGRYGFLGMGLGQYEARYKAEAPIILDKAPYEWVMLHPHNVYLSMVLAVGIMGFVLWFFMVGRVLQLAIIGKYMVVILPLVYVLLHGLLDTPFWKMDMIMLWGMLIVMGFSSANARYE